MSTRELWIVDLGLRSYAEALVIQREAARRRITGEIPQDLLILVEHPPVVTLGRSAKGQHLLASPALLQARGVELFEVERGGDVTFHGPGQLVGYPIVDLKRHRKDLHWYLRQVEEALIQAIGTWGIPAGRVDRYTGVWVGAHDAGWTRKIASIGVHARDWVTWHGFALNVSTDLSYFDLMVPCGIAQVTMTSVARELAGVPVGAIVAPPDGGGPSAPGTPGLREVGARVAATFGTLFDLAPCEAPVEALGTLLECR